MKVFVVCLVLLILLSVSTIGCGKQRSSGTDHSDDNQVAVRDREEIDRIRQLIESRGKNHIEPLRRLPGQTPQEIFDRMIRSYQTAESYSDHGVVSLVGQFSHQTPAPLPCSFAWESSGRLRLEVGDEVLLSQGLNPQGSDGDKHSFVRIRSLPDQILKFATPSRWTIETLFEHLAQAPGQGRALGLNLPGSIPEFPPQTILFFADEPLKTLVPDGSTLELLDPQWILEKPCDLVRVSHAEGSRIFWVQRDPPLLLRLDYIAEGLAVPEGIEDLRLIRFDMSDANVNRPIAPEAFQILLPESTNSERSGEVRIVSEFQSPEVLLLGQKPKDFESLKLGILSDIGNQTSGNVPGKTLRLSDLTDKTVVLCFWSSWSNASLSVLEGFARLTQSFSQDNRVQCLAVNMDRYCQAREIADVSIGTRHPDSLPTLSESNWQDIAQLLKSKNIPLPAYEDPDGRLGKAFFTDEFPTWVVLAPGGTVEAWLVGSQPNAVLSELVRDVLATEELATEEMAVARPHEKALVILRQRQDAYRRMLSEMSRRGRYVADQVRSEPMVTRPSYPRTPKNFSLNIAWTLPQVASPGNIALLPQTSQANGEAAAPLILVPCNGNNLAILDASGKLLRMFQPEGMLYDAMISTIRTVAGANRKHYVGLSSLGGRSVCVYDESFQLLATCQPDQKSTLADEQRFGQQGLGERPISGFGQTGSEWIIADFQFFDIPGNTGQGNSGRIGAASNNAGMGLLLGLLGSGRSSDQSGDALLAVDMQGAMLWQDGTPVAPYQVDYQTVGGVQRILVLDHRDGRGKLLCFDISGSDVPGRYLKTLQLDDQREIVWFHVDDLNADGEDELAVIFSNAGQTKQSFAALDSKGEILWEHPLPAGKFTKPIDRIICGDLIGDEEKEYILPSPDGTVFLFNRKGDFLDSLAFGEYLNGLAVVVDGTEHLLIVADESGLTAWQVVPAD